MNNNHFEDFSKRIPELEKLTQTEEATKMALVVPFLKILGYDVSNPAEVSPEYPCTIGIKKGEKIDYAIMKDKEPIMLIECKHHKQNLDSHNGQLMRYFHVSKARIAILTNGIKYLFFSDLAEPNKMDEKPFWELNLKNLEKSAIEIVRLFHKDNFDLKNILSKARELKYRKELKTLINSELDNPSENFVKFFVKQIYPSTINQKVLDIFTDIVKQIINERIADIPTTPPIDTLKLTEEEKECFTIVKSILQKHISADRIVCRNRQNYFGVMLDDKRSICRVYFKKSSQKYLILTAEGENKEELKKLKIPNDIYEYSEILINNALRLLDKNGASV